MQHNKIIKNNVRELRIKGLSLGQIHEKTGAPKTTIRSWIKDIKLSQEQLNEFKSRTQKALQEGRIRKQKQSKALRLNNEKKLLLKGIARVGNLNNRDFLIAGVALYWGEGFKNKHEHRLGFCNSDPEMIKFYIKWLEESLGIKKESIIARLTLNESYEKRTKEIEDYWSKITGIPKSEFSKTFYQKTKWKRQYNEDIYHGVLRIHVKDSLNMLLLMKGFIEGLKLNLEK
ncbi:MAG: hypothetical protein M1444_00785 [Patescibacteria group bacterium]|nr:hypothetical protein [Patescibacteria group bacterium]